MEQAQLDRLQQWFEAYVRTYNDIDEEGSRNILLKVEHTRKVCGIMELLAEGEGLTAEETRIAGAVALLHDVGRFPQFRRWRTFRDSDSDNHARLGIEVIRRHGLLDGLPDAERTLIEEAVRFHNLLALPLRFKSPTTLYIRLIRDADKLDIWRVFFDYFRQPDDLRPSAVTLGFPDLPEVTPACVAELAAGRIIRLEDVRVLNDFKLLQISWVYDLNFRSSYRLLQERGHIPALAATIPLDEPARQAVALAVAAIEKNAREYPQLTAST
ncbi:MAG: HD domain-containing protein [Desulfuromonadales bacterium]|nr:HD domain-containing protein [Desulfuromonadales bacterium]